MFLVRVAVVALMRTADEIPIARIETSPTTITSSISVYACFIAIWLV